MTSYNKKSVEDIDVNGKKVLVRCDFNVPLKDGVITSDKRIVAALPTIKYLLDHNAAVILCSARKPLRCREEGLPYSSVIMRCISAATVSDTLVVALLSR